MKVDVIDKENRIVDSIELPDEVFRAEVKESLLWEQVKAQRASKRRGTHSTKTRDEVSGSGAKPFKQKGTGRARQGSTRSPNQVGGGTVFGPHPRDYAYRLPRSARRAALRSALSQRASESEILILDAFEQDAPRTKELASFLAALGKAKALVVGVEQDKGALGLSMRNLPKSDYIEARGLNVYDILNHDTLILMRAAVETVVERATSSAATAR